MKTVKYLAAFLFGAALLSCTQEPALLEDGFGGKHESYVPDGDGIVKGWVRIKLAEDAATMRVGSFTRGSMESGDPELDRVAEELGATEVRKVFNEGGKFAERRRKFGLHLWYDVKFDDTLPVSRASAEFASLPGVAHVQPIYKIKLVDGGQQPLPSEAVYVPVWEMITRTAEAPFNDPELGKQWHYNNDGSKTRWIAGSDINAFEAWKTTAGSPDVIVAITDQGVQFDHPDLKDNMWVNEAELNGQPGVDDDNNGYIDDIYGWNAVMSAGEIHPGSHGTHVAGTVGAVNNNGVGVCGVAGGTGRGDGVRLMSMQIYDSAANGTEESRPDAYAYAADNGAVISQNSWGYNSGVGMPQDISDALDYFIANAGMDENGNQTGPMKGGLLVFAAGNDGTPSARQPASDPRTVAVTAMCSDYTKPRYANYAAEVDIYAPGGADGADSNYTDINRVYSTDLEGTYSYMWGTSMACPHVSGVAALIVSHYGVGNPGFTPDKCREILLRSYRSVSQYIDPDFLDKVGVGLVDAGMIFLENAGSSPQAPVAPGARAVRNQIEFTWNVAPDANELAPSLFRLDYTGKGIGKLEGKVEDFTGSEIFRNYTEVGAKAAYMWTARYNTEYSFSLSAVDRFGNVSSSVTFSASTGDYNNLKPQALENLITVEIEDAGEENTRTVALAEYFTDPNAEEGDMLTYSVKNRNENIITATVEGDKLYIVPLSKGEGRLLVTAVDLDGEGAQLNIAVIVKNDSGTVDPIDPVEPGEGGLSLYPNPVGDMLNIGAPSLAGAEAQAVVYDSASRRVMEGRLEFDAQGVATWTVDKLSPGIYSIRLSGDGKTFTGTFLKS